MTTTVLRLLFSLILIGYASNGQAYNTMPVSLTQPDSGTSVVLHQGQILNVSLRQTHADGGYIWQIVPGAESILHQIQKQCVPDSYCTPQMVGCSSMCTFTFEAIATGQTSLKLIEHRPWELNIDPLQIFEVTAIVSVVSVPTMNEWGMVLFMVMAGLGAALALHKQKNAQERTPRKSLNNLLGRPR